MTKKPVLAIDIDDVLAANAEGFVKFSNDRWGTNLEVEDYTEHFADMWKVDEDETARRAIELHESGIIGKYDHFPDAVGVLRRLSKTFTIIAVTSRRRLVEQETRAWIEKYFKDIVTEIRFAGFYDDSSVDVEIRRSKTKSDILQAIDAEYFIDDQLKHCLSAAEAGINVIVFGSYAWNQMDQLPTGVVRCVTWQDVENYFNK